MARRIPKPASPCTRREYDEPMSLFESVSIPFLYPLESKLLHFLSVFSLTTKSIFNWVIVSPIQLSSLMQGGVQWLLTAVDKEKEEKACGFQCNVNMAWLVILATCRDMPLTEGMAGEKVWRKMCGGADPAEGAAPYEFPAIQWSRADTCRRISTSSNSTSRFWWLEVRTDIGDCNLMVQAFQHCSQALWMSVSESRW